MSSGVHHLTLPSGEQECRSSILPTTLAGLRYVSSCATTVYTDRAFYGKPVEGIAPTDTPSIFILDAGLQPLSRFM